MGDEEHEYDLSGSVQGNSGKCPYIVMVIVICK